MKPLPDLLTGHACAGLPDLIGYGHTVRVEDLPTEGDATAALYYDGLADVRDPGGGTSQDLTGGPSGDAERTADAVVHLQDAPLAPVRPGAEASWARLDDSGDPVEATRVHGVVVGVRYSDPRALLVEVP